MPTTDPVAFELYRREHRKGARWRKATVAQTRAELYPLMNGNADFNVAPLVNPYLAASADAPIITPAEQ